MLNRLVTAYVDAAVAQVERFGIADSPAIPSTVANSDLDALEKETGLAYPPTYRDLLKYKHFERLTWWGMGFERHLRDNWRDSLRKLYFDGYPRKRILDVGLLPFGDEAFMDAGPVCFDTRHRIADGDCPVVFWDHEWVGKAKEIQLMFSSGRKMFECLSLVAATDHTFFYHDDDDDAALLPKKRRMLEQFLATDPEGAGGPAKGYWTSWGVMKVS